MVAILGNSLVNLCRAIAQEIGSYQSLPLLSTAADGTHVVAATAADSEAPTSRYGGYYLYSHGPSVLGQQNRVTRAGFVGASGTFTVAKQYSANPASGTTMSLLGAMPWTDQDGLVGLVTCVNRALRKTWIRYRFPITSTGGEIISYDLGALWWASRKRFVRLLAPDLIGAGHVAPAEQPFQVTQNGETWTLELNYGYATGQVFYLDVEAPGNSRLYTVLGGWAQTASPVAGLNLDTDCCLGDFVEVFQCSLFEAYRALSIQAGGARKSYWMDRLEEQRKVVSVIKAYEMDAEAVTLGEGMSDSPGYPTGPKSWRGM